MSSSLDSTTPLPTEAQRRSLLELAQQEAAPDSHVWRPAERPAALPCPFTSSFKGQPALGTAVLDAEAALDPALPLELVPPEEAERTATRILRKGGHYIFSDDYLRRHPQSQAAQLARAYGFGKSPPDSYDLSMTSAGVSTSTAGSAPSYAGSLTTPPKTKKEEMRECVKEAVATSRPIFRPQDATTVYGRGAYVKRRFHDIMDEEYPIEYII